MSFERESPPLLDALSQRLLAQTPLHFACYAGDGHLLDTLIGNTLLYNNNCEQAADSCLAALISEEDTLNGWTPAHWAACYGRLSCLMKLNIRPNLGFDTPSHHSNTSPLHLSAHAGSVLCLKWLLQCGSSTDRQDFLGETALHKAAKAGNMDCAMMLVSHGASLDLKNHRGLTPTDLAEQSNHNVLADHLRQATKEATQCSGSASPSGSISSSTMTNLFSDPSYTSDMPMMSKEDENSRQSYIFMNGEVIHNSFSTESCDMEQADTEIIQTSSDQSFTPASSWSKKRSFDDIEDDSLHSYKRLCSVAASQKSQDGRYGDACNNNIISSYSAVLAMQIDPVSHKTSAYPIEGANKPAGSTVHQSSMMEHEASVVAQHGYDMATTAMNTISHAFH
uniref:Uncharacterized protein n=2 Tax=Arion vulgaris TaxID=1028688 RepID=A0A0B7B892_9EUPU